MSFLRYWHGQKYRLQHEQRPNDSDSFVSRLMKSRSDCIFLVKGKDSSNRPAWYYVLTPSWKKKAMGAIRGTRGLNLNDFGTILHSGYGEEPPVEMKTLMREQFGFIEG